MIFKNKTTQKFISTLLIIMVLVPSLVTFSIPKRAEAAGWPVVDVVGNILEHIGNVFTATGAGAEVTNTAISVKNVLKEITRQFLMAAAKRALAQMTKSTVNWINSGFHGAPLFLENPQSFFNDIAKSEIKNLINIIGYDPNRFPFGKQFALNTIDAYKRQLSDNASYSLSNVINDPALLTNYRNNFSYGGWNAFLLHTQYPQNNFIGSRIQINNELGRLLQGTNDNAAGKVNKTLQQGLGFLSPQTCPSNPSYNNDYNEFNRPSFKPTTQWNPPEVVYDEFGPINQAEFDAYEANYKNKIVAEKANWEKTNLCPGGLTNTTPGSVVSNEIMTSLTSGKRLTELQSALGGSLSAIFDALLNKFLGDGLNALASKVNPQPPADNWDYYGNTLGSPSTDSRDVFSGPDQEVILDEFKATISGRTTTVDPTTGAVTNIRPGNTTKGIYVAPDEALNPDNSRIGGTYIPGDIANTKAELKLMDNSNPNDLGIIQFFSLIWPKVRELDICTPGPNLNWEVRLTDEMERNIQKIQGKLSQDSNTVEDVYQITLASKNLQFAVNFFKDWIKDQMTIPVLEGGLGLPSSSIFLDAVRDVTTLGEKSTDLTKNKRTKREALIRLLSIERGLSSLTTQPLPGSQEEKDLITFKKQYDAIFISISNLLSIEETKSELEIAKEKYGNLSKLLAECTTERQVEGWSVLAEWTKSGGENSTLFSAAGKQFKIDFFWGRNLKGWNPLRRTTKFITTTGNEKEQFCELPIVSGYTHETFVNPQDTNPDGRNVPYPAIPLVNAGELSGLAPSDRDGKPSKAAPFFGAYGTLQDVNMNLSCNIIYQSNILDYKGDALGTTTVTEPPRLPDIDPNSPTNNPEINPPPENCGGTGQIACI